MAAFRKKPAAPPAVAPEVVQPWRTGRPRPEWELNRIVTALRDAAPGLEAREVEPSLVQAWLADHMRDLEITPMRAALFGLEASRLDPDGWRRLALAVRSLDDEGIRTPIGGLAAKESLMLAFLEIARETAPLTVALVRQSSTRAEEFARHVAERLKIGIVGETPEQSQRRLEAIDYKRLLAEAETARTAAEAAMEKLRKKQGEADLTRRRRGKW